MPSTPLDALTKAGIYQDDSQIVEATYQADFSLRGSVEVRFWQHKKTHRFAGGRKMQKYIELFRQKYKGVKSLEEIISISEHKLKYQTQKLRGEERRKRRKIENAKTD